jgi:class 3 adenylate cyclase
MVTMQLICGSIVWAQPPVADSLQINLSKDSLHRELSNAWWRYSTSDNPEMASRHYADSGWKYIHSDDIDSSILQGIGWFRLYFNIDTSLLYKPIALSLSQDGASELYVDGKLIRKFGVIKEMDSIEYFDPQGVPVVFVLDTPGIHVLAMRYGRYHYKDEAKGFSMSLGHANDTIENKRTNDVVISTFLIVLFIAFFTLGLLHFLFFLFYKHTVSNFWFSVFMFCISGIWFSIYLACFTGNPNLHDKLKDAIIVFACLACATFVFFIHIQFNNKGRWWMYIALLLSVVALIGYFTDAFEFAMALSALLVYAIIYSSASLIRAIIKKIQGALILGVGFGFFILSLFIFVLFAIVMNQLEIGSTNSIVGAVLGVILLLDIVSIPATMSVYQAWTFAKLNKDLRNQLEQVKQLSETTLKQEQEKKQILENQNQQLELMVKDRTAQLTDEKQKTDQLLLNILPEGVAEELKNTGSAQAKQYNHVSVLFTDFVNFTGLSESMSPTELVQVIHRNFTQFDAIIEKHGLEKIKTIGDAYMAVCGLPKEVPDHAQRVVKAALEIQEFISRADSPFRIKIGIHSGPVVAGIVGVKKYAYDIWGDTVNTAARMEQNSEAGKINISGTTHELIKREFACEYRGKIKAKNKGEIDMYFVNQSLSVG